MAANPIANILIVSVVKPNLSDFAHEAVDKNADSLPSSIPTNFVMNSNFFDKLETRSSDERDNDNLIKLKKLINKAKENIAIREKLIRIVNETFGSLKNLKILLMEKLAINSFKREVSFHEKNLFFIN